MLQFVCECDVVKDTGKEEYLRPFIHIGLDWIGLVFKWLGPEPRLKIFYYVTTHVTSMSCRCRWIRATSMSAEIDQLFHNNFPAVKPNVSSRKHQIRNKATVPREWIDITQFYLLKKYSLSLCRFCCCNYIYI